MTKKIFTLIALTAMTVSLAGCFSQKETLVDDGTLPVVTGSELQEVGTPTNQPYKYLNKEKEFSVVLPAERTFQENAFNALVMFFAPQKEGDNIKENLGVTTVKLTGDVQLASYFELTKGNTESVIRGYKVEKEEALTVNGENAMKIIYKGTQNDKKLERQQVVFLKGTTAYIFTYTATEDTFNDFIDEVDAIINTFSMQ